MSKIKTFASDFFYSFAVVAYWFPLKNIFLIFDIQGNPADAKHQNITPLQKREDRHKAN